MAKIYCKKAIKVYIFKLTNNKQKQFDNKHEYKKQLILQI